MENKLITFCVPSYNSADYLFRALDSLLPGGEEIEVIIIDDGSKDSTLEIAKEYETKYPNIFKAVHEENRGHGGAINNALGLAKGKYFKVVDSDDWVKEDGLSALLYEIRYFQQGQEPDFILMPYTYRYGDTLKERQTIYYNRFLKAKPRTIFTWDSFRRMDDAHYLTLHSAIYKTSILREEAKLSLPEHCFYEDNYLISYPLRFVRTLYYIDKPFYQYLLGRDGQSMQTQNLIKRNENLGRVATLSFKDTNLQEVWKTNKCLYWIVRHQMAMMLSSYFLYTSLKDKKIAKQEKREFIKNLKTINCKQYKILHRSPVVWWSSKTNFIGTLSSKLSIWAMRKFGSVN